MYLVLDDGNETSISFEKIFTIEKPDTGIPRGFGFRKNGEIIAKMINGDESVDGLFTYELSSKLVNENGVYGKYESLYAYSYVETLLLLDR